MSFRIVNGSTHTEAGWRCCDRNECDIVRIPGLYLTETAPLRKGPPLIILGAWLYWYDRNVEEITTSIWGWSATNDVLGGWGQNNGSNHLSGTAVDVNAPKYPWGLRTMPAARIAKVREGLRLFEGSVFWGADWSRADEMHYQMAWREGDPRNALFAAKLLDGYLGIYKPAPSTKPEEPMAKRFPEDYSDRELLESIAKNAQYTADQVGPGFDAWGEDGDLGRNDKGQRRTLRAGLAALRRKVGA